MKHKIGDKVRIKDIHWYNKYKDVDGAVNCGSNYFTPKMSKYCGKEVVITWEDGCSYKLNIDGRWYWSDGMFEDQAEAPKPKGITADLESVIMLFSTMFGNEKNIDIKDLIKLIISLKMLKQNEHLADNLINVIKYDDLLNILAETKN